MGSLWERPKPIIGASASGGPDGKPSAWSPAQRFTMGLPDREDWSGARWIALEEDVDSLIVINGTFDTGPDNPILGNKPFGRNKLPLLRREFTVDKPVRRATAYVCGLGQFELFLNGEKTGDHFLDPAWTKFDKEAQYVSFDVSDRLPAGRQRGRRDARQRIFQHPARAVQQVRRIVRSAEDDLQAADRVRRRHATDGRLGRLVEGGAGAGHVLEHLRRRGLRCGPCAGRLDLAGLRRQFVERRRAHAVRLPAALAAHDADQDPPAGSDRPQISQLERQLPVRSGAERLGHRPPERARFGPAYREDVSRRALPPRQHGQPAFVGRTGVLQLHDARRRQRRKLAAAVHLLRFPLRGSRGCGARGRAQSERPARDRRADRGCTRPTRPSRSARSSAPTRFSIKSTR